MAIKSETQNKEIGKRIKNIRISLGKDLNSFGKMLNQPASASLVSRWERGVNKPNNNRLQSISEIGHISVDYLLNGLTSEKAKEIKKLKNNFLHGVITTNNDLSENDKRLIKENSIDMSVSLNETSKFEINHILNTFSLENIEKLLYSKPNLLGFSYFSSMFVSALKNTEFTNTDDDIVMDLINLIDNVNIAIRYKNEDDKKSLQNKLKTINNELEKVDDN